MSGLPPVATGTGASRFGSFVPILLRKSFWGGERNFLKPLTRFAGAGVRDHIVHPKLITDLRSRAETPRSSREVQRATFARFSGSFDFRLLQQYLPRADIPAKGIRYSGIPAARRAPSNFSRIFGDWITKIAPLYY
jgi:hypothetical protein